MKVEAGLLSRLAAQWYGSAPALTSGDSTLSFSELNAGANRIGSGLLAAGLDRGDRVGVLAFNTPEVVEAWLGFEKHNLVRAVLHSHIRSRGARLDAQPHRREGARLRHAARRRRRLLPRRAERRAGVRRDRPGRARLGRPVQRAAGRRVGRGPAARRRRGRAVLPAADVGDHRQPEAVDQDLPLVAGRDRPQPAPLRHVRARHPADRDRRRQPALPPDPVGERVPDALPVPDPRRPQRPDGRLRVRRRRAAGHDHERGRHRDLHARAAADAGARRDRGARRLRALAAADGRVLRHARAARAHDEAARARSGRTGSARPSRAR